MQTIRILTVWITSGPAGRDITGISRRHEESGKRGILRVPRSVFRASLMVFAVALILTASTVQAGLVGHWKLDETSGTNAIDSSGNGNDGALHGGDTFADLTISGKVDNAALFDGTADYISGSDAGLPTGNKTIAFWFRNDTEMTATQYQFTYGTKAVSDWFGAYLGPNVWWQNVAGWGDDANWVHDASAYVNGTWYHVVFTWDGANAKFYRDTVKDTTDEAQSWSTVLSGTFTIGAEPFPASYFTGAIDDVAVWDEVLSPTQISNVYLHGAANYNGLPIETGTILEF